MTTSTRTLPSIDEYVFIDLVDTSIQGYVTEVTQTEITLVDWTQWRMGDNRPADGKPGHERVVTITDTTPIRRETADGEDDELL